VKKILAVSTALIALMGASQTSYAEDAVATLTKGDVNTLIENYIKENPQMIIESLQAFEVAQQKRVEDDAAKKLVEHQEYLKSGDLPRVGNPEGDIHIVEFYDYNCGYCKRAFNDLQLLLEADKNVQVTFVEMPILGEASLEVAKWSMAAEAQDKFFEYHSALMKFSGAKSAATLETLATSSGLDVATLKADRKSEAMLDQIEKKYYGRA